MKKKNPKNARPKGDPEEKGESPFEGATGEGSGDEQLPALGSDETPDEDNYTPESRKLAGEMLTSPAFHASLTLGKLDSAMAEFANEVSDALKSQSEDLQSGDLSRAVEMLAAQAATLDGVFHSSLKLASAEGQRTSVVEMLFKVALKAQAQSAKALESIAGLKGGSGSPVLVAQQANVAGQQVVNNYAEAPPQGELPPDECIVRSAKTEKAADQDHATLDDRGETQAIPRHPKVEPVGQVQRTKDADRKG